MEPAEWREADEPASLPAPRRAPVRLGLVFAAGLALGLAGALAVSGPLLERLTGTVSGPAPAALDAPDAIPPETVLAARPDMAGAPAALSNDPPDAALAAPEGPAPQGATASTPAIPAPEPARAVPPEDVALMRPDADAAPAAPTAVTSLTASVTDAPPAPPPVPATAQPNAPSASALPVPDPIPAPASLAPAVETPDGPTIPADRLDAAALAAAALEDADFPSLPQVDRPLPRQIASLPSADAAGAGEAATAAGTGPILAPHEVEADDGAAAGANALPPAAALPSRLVVHVPSAVPEATADRVVSALSDAGYAPTGRVSVGFSIGSTNVRYYFPEDAAAARAVVDAITASGEEATARDFTGHSPKPAPGTVEVYLAGQPRGGGAPAVASTPAAPSPGPASSAAPPQQQQAARPSPPPQPARQADRRPAPQTPADAAMRELEILADEIARAIARSLR